MDATTLHLMNFAHHPWKARMYRAAAQSIATGVDPVVIQFDTVAYDPNGNCTSGASASYTIPVPGFYLIAFQCGLSAPPAAGEMFLDILKNGASIVHDAGRCKITDTTTQTLSITTVDIFVAGDVITAGIFQSTGGAVNCTTGASENFISIHFMSFA
jgi:hypothetical protein